MSEGEQSLVELAVPETETQVAVEGVEDNEVDLEAPELEDGTAPAEDDSEEIDHDGEKYRVPKALKDAFLMQQDYTKKTQEVAEAKRVFEAQQEQFQQQQHFQQQHMQEIVKFNRLGQELNEYQNVDWEALYEQDPVLAGKHDRKFTRLKEEFNQSQNTIKQAEQYQALNQQQQAAMRVEQSRVMLASELKDWTPELGKEVGAYLESYKRIGVDEQVLRDIDRGLYGALPIVLARKAQLYDQLMKKTSAKTNTPPPPPVTKIGSKAAVTKPVEKMSDAEFASWRKRQIAQRR
jgi:uncharacterized protein YdcH (DUF465 family)